ncbi:MAG: hypothetical protein WC595_06800 [Candidatus Nanoarchaeia archaeon]
MIVADSSTLILLAKIGIIDKVLEKIKGEIIIPEEVKVEIVRGKTTDALLLEKRMEMGKIKIRKADLKLKGSVSEDFNLGDGEAEVIAFAIENKVSVMVDDKKAIKACKVFGIEFVTSLGLVVNMVKRGFIEREESERLIDQLAIYGRYSEELIKKAREELK